MNLRKQLSSYVALNNYVEAIRENTSSIILTDAITDGLTGLQLKGSEVKNQPETFLDSVVAKGGTEQRNLPAEYQELEYVESTGTQLIDLGLKWTYGTSTKTVCEMLDSESTALGCVGARNSDSVIWSNFQDKNNTNFTCFGNIVNVQFSQNMVDGNYHTWETNNTGFYLDGVQKTDLSGSDQTLVSTDNIGLFGRYDGAGNIQRCGKWRIKSHQTSVDNTLTQDLIPAKRISDSVIGMYDLISGQFFTNQGTGDFVAGPEVVPTPDAPMDIVSNNGVLKYGKPITLDRTRYYAYLTRGDTWSYSADSYSIIVPVQVGKQYRITADPTTPIDGNVNVILRWAFIDELPPDSWKVESTPAPTLSAIAVYDNVRTTPQETPSVIVTATHPYMIVQMGSGVFASNIANGRISVVEQSIYTDGTVETINAPGKNLFNPAAKVNGYDIGSIGIRTMDGWWVSDYIPIKGGEPYTFTSNGVRNGSAIFLCKTIGTTSVIPGESTMVSGIFPLGTTSITYTIPSGYNFLVINGMISDTADIQIEQGSTATEYEPYYSNTAIVKMLLKVGDYQDVQSILDGVVTRKVGVKVLTGAADEQWGTSVSTKFYWDTDFAKVLNYSPTLCTHYQQVLTYLTAGVSNNQIALFENGAKGRIVICDPRFTIVEQFRQFLADQYAAGTPVIIVYPLNVSETETVSPQKLFKNPVTVTEASIDNLEVTTTETEHTVPTPDYPLDIVCNNGVLKVSPNLFDKNASYALFEGYLVNKSVGQNTTLDVYTGGDKTIIVKVAPNTTYTVTRATNLSALYDRIRCAAFTTLPVGGQTGVMLCNYMNKTQANATFTTLSDTQYVAINVRNSGAVGDDWTQFIDAFQIEAGSTATPYMPYGQIYTDGTVETVTITGNNLLDINKTSGTGYLNTSGELVPLDNYYCSDYIEIKPSTVYTYTETMKSAVQDNYIRFCFYDSNKTFISPRLGDITTFEAKTYTYKITSPINAKYIRISSHSDFVKGQLEEGIRPTKYEEYYQASFASEDLLKLGDYQDVQEIMSGAVTRKIGIKVFDGTEEWFASSNYLGSCYTFAIGQTPSSQVICSHFQNANSLDNYSQGKCLKEQRAFNLWYGDNKSTAIADLKQYLTDQYTMGTPVIVVYPLADTVEETVESRNVFITSGTNTIERNSKYVSSGDISVKYKKLR